MMSLQQSTRFDGLEKNIMAAILDNRADIMGALPAPAPPDAIGSFSEAGNHIFQFHASFILARQTELYSKAALSGILP